MLQIRIARIKAQATCGTKPTLIPESSWKRCLNQLAFLCLICFWH